MQQLIANKTVDLLKENRTRKIVKRDAGSPIIINLRRNLKKYFNCYIWKQLLLLNEEIFVSSIVIIFYPCKKLLQICLPLLSSIKMFLTLIWNKRDMFMAVRAIGIEMYVRMWWRGWAYQKSRLRSFDKPPNNHVLRRDTRLTNGTCDRGAYK